MAKPLIDIVKVGKRGEIVLPRRVRSGMGLQEGDELILTMDDNKKLVFERRARGLSTYLDVMNSAAGSEEDAPPTRSSPPERRGLARFLTR